MGLINDLVSNIRYKLACVYSKDSNHSVHQQSEQSNGFPPEETLHPWLYTECPLKTDQIEQAGVSVFDGCTCKLVPFAGHWLKSTCIFISILIKSCSSLMGMVIYAKCIFPFPMVFFIFIQILKDTSVSKQWRT